MRAILKIIPILLTAALLVPSSVWAQRRGERERKQDAKQKRASGRPKARPKVTRRQPKPATAKKAVTKAGEAAPDAKDNAAGASGAGAAAGTSAEAPLTLPGEKEFNECVRIPPRRRIKVTLKKDSDLNDLVAWISSMTCKKFIVASTLRAQKVTIVSPTPVTAREAYRAFLSALEVMGLTVVPVGRYLKVVQGNWAIQSPIPTYGDKQGRRIPASDAVVTQIVQVRNVDVNELLLVLNKMKSRSGDVTAYKASNSLIITDNGNNVRRLLRIIEELDVAVEGEKIWVVRLKYAAADEVNKVLTQIFAQRGNRPKVRRPKVKRGKKKPGSDVDVGSVSASKIVPDSDTNSLIIVASATAFSKIASLIKKLDVESDGSNQRIHVYYLENADADELSQTLSGLTGGTTTTRRTRGRKRRKRSGASTATLFEGNVQISADKATNSLVIVATNKDYLALRRVIKKLDIPRRQVFVEASILEISLDKGRKLGFAYHGGGLTGEGDDQSIIFGGVQHSEWGSLVFNPLALMGLAVGARGALIDGSAQLLNVSQDVPGFGVMFQAIQNNNNVNVLSSPHILTTDNEEAEITVGQNIPFQGAFVGGGFPGGAGQQGGQQGAAAFASFLPGVSVQRQDVALKLKITPHVNDSDMVRLELEQEVSDIASQNFNGLGPSTSKRTAKTVVVVRDQQTVVIGGLMGNRVRDTVSKVPLLGDIPILGYLFKYSNKTIQKTNLLIVLTPYVIRDQSDLRRIFKKKLEERREFIERYTSFDSRELSKDIDFRHKRGLLAEINRVAAQVEKEARLLEEARRQTEAPLEPVDMPRGMSPSESGGSSSANIKPMPGYDNDIKPPRKPAIHPTKSIRLKRRVK